MTVNSGIFISKEFEVYQFYEATDTQYYRLDICKRGTPFQTDPSGVVYSLYRKKKVFTYGDTDLYNDFKEFKEIVYNTHGDVEKKSYWDEGKYYTVTEVKNEKKEFDSRTVTVNGTLSNFESHYCGRIYQYTVTNAGYSKMDPFNINEYTELTVSMADSDSQTYTTPYYPYEVLVRRYDLQHILERDLVVADTQEIAEQRLKEWCECDEEYLGFDTETTGLDVWKYGDDVMVGIILSCGEKASTYFPFRMKSIPNLSKEFLDRLMAACKERESRLVAHNKKFDRQVMLKEGYDLRIKWCTLILSFMLNPITVAGSHALKELMMALDKKKYLELEEIFISKKSIDFSLLPKLIVLLYACTDSTSAVTLLKHLIPQVPLDMWPIILIEMQLADLKADQEFYGMRVDVNKYQRNYVNCEYVLSMLLQVFRKMTHEDGNIGSADVLSTLLYDKLGCKVLMRTKTGRRSTSGKAIDKLASVRADKPHHFTEDIVDLEGKIVIKASTLNASKYPALVVLSKYREYNKRKTAFYARFERTMKVGRIHFWINQNGASSGRQSSPMHQLPPELKDVMLSDSEDKDLWGPDYSQIELRMIAFLANEPDLIEMCKDPDNDIHRVCASLITGKQMWEITPEERSVKKRVNFGVVYLISGYGLAGQLYGPGYSKEQVEYCQEQLDAFYARFKRIDLYLKTNALKVQKNGYMKTWFNRVKYFKEIFDPDITNRKRASVIRQSNNMPVQGTAADIMKIAEVNTYNYIREKGWNELDKDGFPKVRAMLSIHDEMLISASRDIAIEEIISMISQCMQIDIEGAPPFFVAPAKMENWGGHSDDSLAVPIRYRDKLIADYNRTGKTVFKRSYFEVGIAEDVASAVRLETLPVHDLVDKYIDKATFKYMYGDCGTELTEKEKLAAFTAYISSNQKRYVKENYLMLLNDYRDGVLRDYMLGLYDKCGHDVEKLGKLVRHPSLTHELLALYHKEMKDLDLSHEEKIDLAAKYYIERLDVEQSNVIELREYQKVKVTDMETLLEESENLYTFDKDGNVVYEEEAEEEEEYLSDVDVNNILYRTEGKIYRVWKMVNTIIVDVDRLATAEIDRVLAELWKYRDTNGFYSVFLAFSGRMIDVKFKIEDLDMDAMTDFILSLEKIAS